MKKATSMKASAIAPSNLAFIKYWGRTTNTERLPVNSSISMNLSQLFTHTTVEFSSSYQEDEVIIDEKKLAEKELLRISRHLDRIRKLKGISSKAKVVSHNNFPSGTGLSSSASGFAALTVAATAAVSLELSEKELSILARQGSGSAARSIPSGFVEWLSGESSQESYARSLYPADYWKVIDVVAVVSEEKKAIPTSQGQELAFTSPFFMERVKIMPEKISHFKEALKNKDFTALGTFSEQDALEMHAIMITSQPPLLYWTTGSLLLMKAIHHWRNAGLEIYFSLNTGQDVHILCQENQLILLQEKLSTLSFIKKTYINYPAEGTKVVDNDLF